MGFFLWDGVLFSPHQSTWVFAFGWSSWGGARGFRIRFEVLMSQLVFFEFGLGWMFGGVAGVCFW